MSNTKGLSSVKTLTANEIAKKWDLPLKTVAKKIAAGIKVEKEHTKSTKQANEIARDHLGERPDYYEKLDKMEKTKVVKEMVSSVVQSWPSSKNIEDTRAETGKAWQSKIYHAGSVAGQAFSNIKNRISPPEKPNMNPKAEPLPSSYGGRALPSASGGSTGTGIQKDSEMSIKNQGTADRDYLTSTSISGGDSKSPTTPSNKSYTPTPGSGTSTPTTPKEKPLKEPDEVVNAQGSVFDRMNRLKEDLTGVDGVRGLGYVTGDPGVNPVQNYINTNAMAYEDENGNALKYIQKMHDDLHNKGLGFQFFNPTNIKTSSNKDLAESRLDELGGDYDRSSRGVDVVGDLTGSTKTISKLDVKEEKPCWKGYEMVGMKKKGKRKVPNCVPVKEQGSPANPSYTERPTYEGKNVVPAQSVERGIYEVNKKEVKEYLEPYFITAHKEGEKSIRKRLGGRMSQTIRANKPDAGLHPGAKGTKDKTTYESVRISHLKEETKMDTKELINEALDNILEENLIDMKENLMTALQEKAMEKLEERKKIIASDYFAQ